MSKTKVDRKNALKLVESILSQNKKGAEKALKNLINTKVKQSIGKVVNTTHLI